MSLSQTGFFRRNLKYPVITSIKRYLCTTKTNAFVEEASVSQSAKVLTDGAFRRKTIYGSTVESTYAGALSFLRRNYTRNLENVEIAVTGIPLDLATTFRPGTRFGPAGIRQASCQLAELKSYPDGIDLFEDLAVIDYGDCYFDPSFPHTVPEAIENHAWEIIKHNVFLFSLGGDHYGTYPLLKAHVKHHKRPLALVQFDAHCDTWKDTKGLNHGTMFYHAIKENLIDPEHSIQVGIRTFNDDFMGVKILDADFVHSNGPAKVAEEILERVGNHKCYLTFDIDCLDPAFAPGTGTPVSGGLSTYQALSILRQIRKLAFVGGDIVEVSPPYDNSSITSLAAATIGYNFLCLLRNKKILDKTFNFGNRLKKDV